MPTRSDEELRDLLARTRTIAVVGIKAGAEDDAFRAPQHVPAHVDEILAMSPRPRAVWMQLGVSHEESARRLEAAGIAVVQDRCIMVDHRRLLGPP